MKFLDDRLLELALQTSSEPILILNSDLCIVWANLAAHEEPDQIRSVLLEDFLFNEPPAAEYYRPEMFRRLNHKLATLPFGEVRWRPVQVAPSATGGAVLVIRWHLLAEMPERYILLKFQNQARRRSDPGPAEQALRSQQLFMNQLIHELRTPLAIAQGSLRRVSMKMQEFAPPSSSEYLQMTAQELKRMQRLIDHLSVLTDLDAGSQRWKLRPLLVHQLLVDWYNLLPESSRSRFGLLLLNEVERDHISVDPDAFVLVLNNLLDNALRYGPADRDALVVVASDGANFHLYVADWGSGIPESLGDSVFDRFRRLEQHRDPSRADGAGLGLAVCRALLGIMNGQISFLPLAEDVEAKTLPAILAPNVIKVRMPLLGVRAEHELPRLTEELTKLSDDQLSSADQLLNHLRSLAEIS